MTEQLARRAKLEMWEPLGDRVEMEGTEREVSREIQARLGPQVYLGVKEEWDPLANPVPQVHRLRETRFLGLPDPLEEMVLPADPVLLP